MVCAFFGKMLSSGLSKFLRDWKVNSYCKKDYSKCEVNAVETINKRLQKMKKKSAIASFYCLVAKIKKKNSKDCNASLHETLNTISFHQL